MSIGANGCGSKVAHWSKPMGKGRGNGHSSAGREEPLAFPTPRWDASKFVAPYECLLSAGIAHVSACVNAKNGATNVPLPRSRTEATVGLLPARCRPEVDAAIGGVAINFSELVRRKRQLVDRTDVLFQLRDAARADQRRRHPRVAQRPGERHLGQRLAAPLGQLAQRPHLAE